MSVRHSGQISKALVGKLGASSAASESDGGGRRGGMGGASVVSPEGTSADGLSFEQFASVFGEMNGAVDGLSPHCTAMHWRTHSLARSLTLSLAQHTRSLDHSPTRCMRTCSLVHSLWRKHLLSLAHSLTHFDMHFDTNAQAI
jgi:hypothetical protein